MPLAPYMEWAKTRPSAKWDLAISNVLGVSINELPGAADALALSGRNDSGYEPLMDAIGRQYGVRPSQVTTAQGASGANFLVYAALLRQGEDVLVERPGYDPLIGAARLVGAHVIQFDRRVEDGFALDPERVRAAMTPRTKLIVITSPHNPTSVVAHADALRTIGDIAVAAGARVLVDEVYLDATARETPTSVTLGDQFIVTSSLTKSYGLAGLRCGWILSSEAIAAQLRRARDVVDGTGSIVAERLGVLAFAHLDQLHARARTLLDINMPLVHEFLRQRPQLACPKPRGGTVIFPMLLNVEDTSRFAEQLLTERDTAIVPGHFFQSPKHFRLGFSGPTDQLRGGLENVAAALDACEW